MICYKVWRAQVFQEQFAHLQSLLSPHWSIQHYPVPKQPFRLSVNSTIVNQSISFVVPNPVTLERWWEEKGKALTERLTTAKKRQAAAIVQSGSESLSIEKPTCLNCRWHDPQHEGNRFGAWCSFYREAFSDDRIAAMPQHCGKWRNSKLSDVIQAEASEFQTKRQLLQAQGISMSETVHRTVNHAINNVMDNVSVTALMKPTNDELEAVFRYIEQCSEDQLKQLEAAIQARRNLNQSRNT
jgi:hypothetical protein